MSSGTWSMAAYHAKLFIALLTFVDIANARHISSLLGSALAYCNIALLLFLGQTEKSK